MADILTKLSNKFGCDKSDKNHRYTKIYNEYFHKDMNKKFNMLELGFGIGSSVKMWLSYFKNIRLFSIDNMKNLPEDKLLKKFIKENRFIFLSSDQIDKDKILSSLNSVSDFYIIVDDASHIEEDQQFTFGFLFEKVSKGGYYIIEDLKCKRNHNKSFKVEAEKTLKVLEDFIDTKNFKSKVLTKKQLKYINDNIESVSIFNKIAFIKKKG